MNSDQNNINIINLLNEQHDAIKKKITPIPIEILDDLSSRFIINLPNEERGDIIRVLFQIELAHWFYIDFYVADQPDLFKYNLKPFAKLMFKHVPYLRQYLDKFDDVFDQWKDYKHNVPTYGAIILDDTMENVLMVQGFWSNTTWGFPKGKINAEEDPIVCACREVKEEIGFDCTDLIEDKEFIEMHIRETYIRLYIIAGVSKDEKFQTLTRNEIKKIQWFAIKDLPASRHEKELNPNAFFMVIPIIKTLKRWIYERRTLNNGYNKAFNNNFISNRYSSSPVSKQHLKENNYSTKNHLTQQFNHANGNNFNRRPDKLFNSSNDKITILKNNSRTPKQNASTNGRFWSKTFQDFNQKFNIDDLWRECLENNA